MTDIQTPADPSAPIVVLAAKRGRKPGFKGSSNRNIKYACDTCGCEVGRDNLLVKRAVYLTLTEPVKAVRTRTVGWFCRPCSEAQPDYKREALTDSPGMRDVRHDQTS